MIPRVRLTGSTHSAKRTGVLDDRGNELWELPSLDAESQEEHVLEITRGIDSQLNQIRLPPSTRRNKELESATERLIDHHVDRIREWLDGKVAHRPVRAEGLTLAPWDRLLDSYTRVEDDNKEPPLQLIVRIARTCRDLIEDLCHRPRVQLRRNRSMVPISKAQDIDDACLRWLVRQPGNTLVQRAGVRQRVLAVVREESIDTPENRVLRDFLRMAQRASRRYIHQYQDYTESKRIQTVRSYLSLIEIILRSTRIQEVPPLVGAATANYVLQFDSRYSELWDWYLRLRREEDDRDDLSAWRHRTWSERCLLLAAKSCRDLSNSQFSFYTDACIRGEADHGGFMDRRSMPGPWTIRDTEGGLLVRLLNPAEAQALNSPEINKLMRLAPDFLITFAPAFEQSAIRRVLAVCTMFTPLDQDAEFQARLDRAEKAFPATQGGGVLVLTPGSKDSKRTLKSQGKNVTGIRLPIQAAGNTEENVDLSRILKIFFGGVQG